MFFTKGCSLFLAARNNWVINAAAYNLLGNAPGIPAELADKLAFQTIPLPVQRRYNECRPKLLFLANQRCIAAFDAAQTASQFRSAAAGSTGRSVHHLVPTREAGQNPVRRHVV
jgi:hypothetical protein